MEQKLKREPLGKGFYLYVNKNHTFGTDAVLLSNFATAKPKDKMVDLGTGCGIIPLLMLRDGLLSSAVGVDISEEAISLAQKTKEELNIDRFTAINCDLKVLKGKVEFGCHTLVTCNPPYKAPNAGLKNPNERLRVARHEVECTLRDIVEVSAKLLQTGGRLCMCHRPERLSELMRIMSECRVEPKRLRLVCQRKGEEPWLVLIEGKRCSKTGLRIEPTLYVEEDGSFSKEMIEIYGAYKEAYL
ncbi:MAG: methyltransferase domain-containing protein [Ruminococcaceae bacterium]|nr:methyltransferase domain-containing protein [Oscillospiraceae bacterium]